MYENLLRTSSSSKHCTSQALGTSPSCCAVYFTAQYRRTAMSRVVFSASLRVSLVRFGAMMMEIGKWWDMISSLQGVFDSTYPKSEVRSLHTQSPDCLPLKVRSSPVNVRNSPTQSLEDVQRYPRCWYDRQRESLPLQNMPPLTSFFDAIDKHY
jgi:hypothetical protein